MWVVVLVGGWLLLSAGGAKKSNKLVIDVTHKPEDCTTVTATGDTVTVHYTGKLTNGRQFDSSRQEGREPFTFQLGSGQVIKGWEEGLLGMCVGEQRKLTIPSNLAYGPEGRSPIIPSDATLVFDTELVALQKASVGSAFSQLDTGTLTKCFLVGMLIYTLYSTYKKYVAESSQPKQASKTGRKKKAK
ncbi:FK506-binding protein 2-like [Corticium candelabrum]|uniref:FK506-binding protein 2-like n=1 Tax=Corticium candelabrum TaxID=121492 RepID=UPI002E26C2C6|nr:FK506-binding protein 2-like [Corticium candelabrum]